jgi:carboxyl-terminal processing protease
MITTPTSAQSQFKCARIYTNLKLLAVSSMLMWLAACGGGGSDATGSAASPAQPSTPPSSSSASQATPSGPGTAATVIGTTTATTASLPTLGYTAASVAQQCIAPRVGEGFTDVRGSIDTEKLWVRAFLDETYLFYKDIPKVDPAAFTAAAFEGSSFEALRAYFRSLLTPKLTASGNRVDQFSFIRPTQSRSNEQAGVSSGYGISFARLDNPTTTSTTTRIIRVLRVEPGSPGDLAGVLRGDTVKSIDGVDINDTTEAGEEVLFEGLNPSVAIKTTTFGLQAAGSDEIDEVVVVSSTNIATVPVEIAKTLHVGSSKVGYLVLNTFALEKAQEQLIKAITKLKSDKVDDLVLDLRYNGGGIVLLANQLSYMIGGADLKNKVFEKTVCNGKNPSALCDQANPFVDVTIGDSVNNVVGDRSIPQLGLKRVFVLTTASTCSASESVINGLSPYLQVIRIGSTTCGKPFAFVPKDNCGTTYFALQSRIENALGFSSYEDGFAPTCAAADDLSRQRGDPHEMMLAGALKYITAGKCTAASASPGSQKTSLPEPQNYKMMRSPMEEMRIMEMPRKSTR